MLPSSGSGAADLLRAALEANTAQIAALAAQHAGIVAASQASNADDEHDPEGSTIAFERAQVATLLQQAHRTRTELASALERVEQGTYGTCERCGSAISAGRLEARPDARTCITCASAFAAQR